MAQPSTQPNLTPRLTRAGSADPQSVVLMLHGGQPRSTEPVGARSTSWLRMRWLQHELAADRATDGLALCLLRYRVRGWNGGAGPVADARWALDDLAAAHPGRPIVLLGHSMGGRVAVHAADHPAVTRVVALAPWLEPGDPVAALTGRDLVAAHGRHDRITSYAATRAFVERARAVAASAELVDMGPLGHYLLRGRGAWHRTVVDSLTR